MTDYAVVVGIAKYPGLTDLTGPDTDAQAVHDWLVDPAGGRLDEQNVELIRSAQFDPVDPRDPKPASGAVKAALVRIAAKTQQAPGNRLYLYFSGHGFAPTLEEGALFTAEASQLAPFHVYAHSWLKAFRRAGLFRDVVLWMDCCMNYQQSIMVDEADMRIAQSTRPPGPAFVGLAAQTKSALEHTMPDGKVHGVFTWTLLEVLKGGAADERGPGDRRELQGLPPERHARVPARRGPAGRRRRPAPVRPGRRGHGLHPVPGAADLPGAAADPQGHGRPAAAPVDRPAARGRGQRGPGRPRVDRTAGPRPLRGRGARGRPPPGLPGHRLGPPRRGRRRDRAAGEAGRLVQAVPAERGRRQRRRRDHGRRLQVRPHLHRDRRPARPGRRRGVQDPRADRPRHRHRLREGRAARPRAGRRRPGGRAAAAVARPHPGQRPDLRVPRQAVQRGGRPGRRLPAGPSRRGHHLHHGPLLDRPGHDGARRPAAPPDGGGCS